MNTLSIFRIGVALVLFLALAGCGDNDPKAESYDVYVYGTINNHVYYWKNGVSSPIGRQSGAWIESGTSSGTDVYLCGSDDGATVWKNGVATQLSNGGLASQVAVVGSDVYVTGERSTTNGKSVAAYWKNGVHVFLGDSTLSGRATGITVSGSDVHVVGWQIATGTDSTYAVYWKNGKATRLPHTALQTFANTIALSGGDVLIGGYETASNTAPAHLKYWKNGALDGSINGVGIVTKIVVFGSDVYVLAPYAGVAYWKNGNMVQQGEDRAAAMDIALVNNDFFMVGLIFPMTASSTFSTPLYKNGNIVVPFDGKDLSIFLQGVLIVPK